MASDEHTPTTTVFTEPVERIQCSQCGHIVDMRGSKPFSERYCPSCGACKKVPARLGSYLLLDCIGTGGMGAVFRGLDPSLDRIVAVKVMSRVLGEDPAALAAFRKEARAAARFNHPHAAQVFTFGEAHGQPYIVMEFVTGRPMSDLVAASGALDQALSVRVGMQTSEALAAAAATDLLHGDVKPENIIVGENGQSKLIDFGLASIAEMQAQGQIWGSPYYLAPERILRQKPDFRADIYSLGASLYESLAARPPFTGETVRDVLNAHLAGAPTAVSVYRRDLDPEIERVIMRMIRRVPAERYPNYDSLIGDLRRILNRLGGYPGRGKRLAPHGAPTTFRIRSEPTPRGASLRAIPDAPPPQLRAIPEDEPALMGIPDSHQRPPSRRAPASRADPAERWRQSSAAHRDDAPRHSAPAASHARREQRQLFVSPDPRHATKKPSSPPAQAPHKEPNILPFFIILGVIAVAVMLMIASFVASESRRNQPSPDYSQPDSPTHGRQTQTVRPHSARRAPKDTDQAADDSATTRPGRRVSIPVLDNDSAGSDGKPPVIMSITSPQNGIAAVERGAIAYRPQAGFSGRDQFQYTVRYPSGRTSTATVTIEVAGN